MYENLTSVTYFQLKIKNMKKTKTTACFKKQLRNKTSEIFGKNKKQN